MWLFIHLIYIVEFRGRILVFVQCGFEYPTFSRGARLITGDAVTDSRKNSMVRVGRDAILSHERQLQAPTPRFDIATVVMEDVARRKYC